MSMDYEARTHVEQQRESNLDDLALIFFLFMHTFMRQTVNKDLQLVMEFYKLKIDDHAMISQYLNEMLKRYRALMEIEHPVHSLHACHKIIAGIRAGNKTYGDKLQTAIMNIPVSSITYENLKKIVTQAKALMATDDEVYGAAATTPTRSASVTRNADIRAATSKHWSRLKNAPAQEVLWDDHIKSLCENLSSKMCDKCGYCEVPGQRTKECPYLFIEKKFDT